MSKRSFLAPLLAAISVLSAAPALAQVAVGMEGTITDIDSSTNTITVLGVKVQIPANTVIESPTTTFTDFNSLLGSPLPGRNVPGFLGGTAILDGTSNPSGGVTATSLFVEPAENVIIGPLGVGATSILGTPLSVLTDARIPGSATNAYGFQINLGAVQAGTLGGVEGYFADGTLYAHTVEVDAPIPPAANTNTAQVSILRVTCEPGGRLEIRGGGYAGLNSAGTPIAINGRAITVFNANNGSRLGGTTVAVDDPLVPQYGLYRFRLNTNTCPQRVRVTMNSAPNAAIADVP